MHAPHRLAASTAKAVNTVLSNAPAKSTLLKNLKPVINSTTSAPDIGNQSATWLPLDASSSLLYSLELSGREVRDSPPHSPVPLLPLHSFDPNIFNDIESQQIWHDLSNDDTYNAIAQHQEETIEQDTASTSPTIHSIPFSRVIIGSDPALKPLFSPIKGQQLNTFPPCVSIPAIPGSLTGLNTSSWPRQKFEPKNAKPNVSSFENCKIHENAQKSVNINDEPIADRKPQVLNTPASTSTSASTHKNDETNTVPPEKDYPKFSTHSIPISTSSLRRVKLIQPLSTPLNRSVSEYRFDASTTGGSVSSTARTGEELLHLLKSDAVIRNQFHFMEVLGFGAFGIVVAAQHSVDRKLYALKVTHAKEGLKEIALLSHLPPHANLVTYYTSYALEDAVHVVIQLQVSNQVFQQHLLQSRLHPLNALDWLEFRKQKYYSTDFPPSSLDDRGLYSCRYDELEAVSIFRDVVQGVNHLHQHGVIHRDIKPSNLLLFYHQNKVLVAKLCDLGLATPCKTSPTADVLSDGYTEAEEHSCGVGTSTYASPEQLCHRVYGTSSDIYSLGILFYEMMCTPFNTAMERAELFTRLRDSNNTNSSSSVLNLFLERGQTGALGKFIVASCLRVEPDERLTAANLLYYVNNLLDLIVKTKSY